MDGNRYPRESQEPVIFDEVTVNGAPTLAFTYQLQRKEERPASGGWQTPIDVAGQLGFMLQPVPMHGTYVVWVKVSQSGANIVIEAGEIVRT